MKRTLLSAALIAAALLLVVGNARADACWIHTPSGYQRMGGAARIGPYGDGYEANRVNNRYFSGQGRIECAKSRRGGGGGTPRFKYGAAHFHNRTSGTISMSVRTSPGGSGVHRMIPSGHSYWWWRECPCRFHVPWDGSAGRYQRPGMRRYLTRAA
jgi:hypothetical protein